MFDPEQQIIQSTAVTQQLVRATLPRNYPLVPNDLQVSTQIMAIVIEVLENNGNATDTVNLS